MTETEPLTPADWYTRGERDMKSARALLAGGNELISTAGIFLYQGVRKYLKGYVLERTGALRQTEELFELLAEAMLHDSNLRDFATACVLLTDFYFEHRAAVLGSAEALRSELDPLLIEANKLIAHLQGETGFVPPPTKS
jgi:HEPN domain-containing protein